MRFPFYKQLDAMDCGPTCLRMIAKYYGKTFSVQQLRDQSFIQRTGVNMLGISEAATSIGLRATGIRTSMDKLDVCSFFNKYHLTDIQISLDGVETTHNKSRILKKGNDATYQVILDNIYLLLKECPNVKIHIRVNVSQNNVEEYIIVKNQLEELFHSKQIEIYPGFIFVVDRRGQYLIPPSLLRQQKQAVFLKDRDYKTLYPSRKGKGCTATQINSYIVGSFGELYKCWGDANNQNRIIGHLNGRVGNVHLANQYLSTSCFTDEKCIRCFFLPICGGGCNKDRVANNEDNGEFDLCSLYKDREFFEECLERYYLKTVQTNLMKQ